MTLGDFLALISANPSVILFYYIALPLTAFLASVFGKGEGDISPWKYLYAVLVYLACIPGIFAISLCVYQFLFERQSIMDTNIYTEILPIACMILTLWLVRRNVDFKDIPGFGKLSGLMLILGALIALMWVMEKTHILVISIIPFHYFIVGFIVLLVIIRFGWKKLSAQ
jgi:hypothetical protein